MVKKKKKKKINSSFEIPSKEKPGVLYIVGTPIGNIEDITLRAIKILNTVDLIAAEDTRVTRKLLNKYYIKNIITSYYDYNKEKKVEFLINELKSGKKIALVSDAGTPGISDPAYLLMKKAMQNEIHVEPIPGVSALTTAISVSSLPSDKFTFYGFLPTKAKKKSEILQQIEERNETAIFFESPYRIRKTMTELAKRFSERNVVIAREITKKHETFLRGNCKEVAEKIDDNVNGEFTIILQGNKEK